MSRHYADALDPVWPELVEVIAESPALILAGHYYIVEIEKDRDVPDALMIFRDDTEITALVSEVLLPEVRSKRHRGPYKAIRFILGRPFSAPGFLASAALAIARSRVNQLIYSTYSFDYVLVKVEDIEEAVSGLNRMGFVVNEES